jgi:hypothetical protein
VGGRGHVGVVCGRSVGGRGHVGVVCGRSVGGRGHVGVMWVSGRNLEKEGELSLGWFYGVLFFHFWTILVDFGRFW